MFLNNCRLYTLLGAGGRCASRAIPSIVSGRPGGGSRSAKLRQTSRQCLVCARARTRMSFGASSTASWWIAATRAPDRADYRRGRFSRGPRRDLCSAACFPTRTVSPSSRAFCEFTSARECNRWRGHWNSSSSWTSAERERLLLPRSSQILLLPLGRTFAGCDPPRRARVARVADASRSSAFQALHDATIRVASRRTAAKSSFHGTTSVSARAAHAGVRNTELPRTLRIQSRCILARRFRCCGPHDQRRRLAAARHSIRAAFCGWRGRSFRRTHF